MRALTALAATVLTAALLAGCGSSQSKPVTLPGMSNGARGTSEFGHNVVRIPGRSATDVAAAAILAAYPPEEDRTPNGWVLFPDGDWRSEANAAQFVGDPINAGLLPIKPTYLPTAAADLINRVHPPGFPKGEGLETMIMGSAGNDVVTALEEANLRLTRTTSKDPASLSNELVPYRGTWGRKYSSSVVVISENARSFALPGMAWCAFSGDPVALVTHDRVPPATAKLLLQRQQLLADQPTIYIVGPPSVIGEQVESELSSYGDVKRVSGSTPVTNAIAMARYKDLSTGFGWGVGVGPANVAFVNSKDPVGDAGALTLAGAGPRAPLLLLKKGTEVPKPVVSYLDDLTSKDGNQGYVLGNRSSVSRAQLVKLDALLQPVG